MKHVKKSVLLWYSPREMYDLVVDVPAYPQFLPWCQKAEVLAQSDHEVTARLHLSFGGVRHAFTTRNTHVSGEQVSMALVDGPFSSLEGAWRFVPIGTPAAATPGGGAQACRVEFELRYAFSSRPLELVVSPVFDRIANTFVDAFVARAEQVHGKR
ncbi:type II toxin-antitoxin system RatA family toxin [Leptothrix discophora]|uniref:Type II toxin-antitoxin system RatA family toxin n=1 Tax=Leptothrix discophora TaxID=89 RepID=A0ABT9G1C7_LEPDI|nr:type II toxin-antitoxin system RatA family toxin [Leptothrix discophora]MDP4300225.1 type II toxin-antitoxin system RatA family toxin [Leptothrix discophora]